MRTNKMSSVQFALLLALGTASLACGSEGSGGEDDLPPDLGGNGSGGNGGATNGNAGSNSGGTSKGDGGPDDVPKDCVSDPARSNELLNSCPPEGVERRKFDNGTRIKGYAEPLPDLPS